MKKIILPAERIIIFLDHFLIASDALKRNVNVFLFSISVAANIVFIVWRTA